MVDDFLCDVREAAMHALWAFLLLDHIATASRNVVEAPVLQDRFAERQNSAKKKRSRMYKDVRPHMRKETTELIGSRMRE